jgi:DNA invertase Pin-like site-specific DNA recombinase
MSSKSNPKVYSYMRFSDPRQAAGTSSDRQIAYAASWAQQHGIPLDTSLTLRDEGLSAYHQRHVKSGALGVFLAAVEAGKVDPGSFLIVEGLDRLSRAEPIQAQAQLASIINAGITVVTAADSKVYSREHLKANPMDLVYSLLVMIRAHEESDTKSKRVRAAILRKCADWQAGTWRGILVNGKDPAWCERDGTTWCLIPERVAAVRHALDLFRRGYGAVRIVRDLHQQGLTLTGRGPASLQIYRLIRQRALVGDKVLEIDGETHTLRGYYPPLLTDVEFADLQALADDRGRRKVKGQIPHLITGLGITTCGYCGTALVGQTTANRNRLPDGRIRDSHRRLQCVSNSHGDGCPVAGSMSEVPVERAIMAYCSDLMNLQALYGPDRTSGPRAALLTARNSLREIDEKLAKLTDAMLESDEPPAAFIQRARQFEQQKADTQLRITALEREIAASVRADTSGLDQLWQSLRNGVEAQDFDARMQARQLVADTFEKIVVYRYGLRPGRLPAGQIAIVLLAKGGITRLLHADKSGRLISAEDYDRANL